MGASSGRGKGRRTDLVDDEAGAEVVEGARGLGAGDPAEVRRPKGEVTDSLTLLPPADVAADVVAEGADLTVASGAVPTLPSVPFILRGGCSAQVLLIAVQYPATASAECPASTSKRERPDEL